ncbi:MAG: alpha-amylase family glycosyl hydrolase [Anaerobacillus sp.]|uniref:alpha-amylase family glycosyl hydrolase n=1 Tax=Anaerobacillus sp. TaxID=1872506 RepID=UPI0039197AD8
MIKKQHKRLLSLYMSLLMIFSVFTGYAPVVTAEGTSNSSIEVDWEKVPTLARSQTAGWQGFNIDNLKVKMDENYFYFYVEAKNVANWGERGLTLNLGLNVNDVNSNVSAIPSYQVASIGQTSNLKHAFKYSDAESFKKPQYNIQLQVKNDNEVYYGAVYNATNLNAPVLSTVHGLKGAQFKVDRTKSFQGKIPLSELNFNASDDIRAIAVLSGNHDWQHGAFDVIPKVEGNTVATSWNHQASPNVLSVYSDVYEAPQGLLFTGSTPADGATNVSIGTDIRVNFADNINLVNASKIEVVDHEANSVAFTATVTDNRLTVVPANKLLNSKTYTVKVLAGAVSAKESGAINDELQFSFSTRAFDSPVIHTNGTVTFNAAFNGDELYMVGSLNDWNIANAIAMDKQDGRFTKTLPLAPGTYQYKFIPQRSWTGGDFVDPLNPKVSGGNSVVHVPGVLLPEVPSNAERNDEITLKARFLNDQGNTVDVDANWSLVEPVAGVNLDGNKLTVASSVPLNREFKVRAEHQGFTNEKMITVVATMFEYTINYYRFDGNQSDWNLWIWGNGMPGSQFDFAGKNDEFATGTYRFANNSITFKTRLGDWQAEESERTITVPAGQKKVEVWIVQGTNDVFYSKNDVLLADPPAVRFHYERADKNYEGWNIWTWNTGAKDGQIDFDRVVNDVAIANIEVGAKIERMGFKVRRGTGWNNIDVDVDRLISVSPTESITKVFVKSGQQEFRTLPFARGPLLDAGNATFYYRDANLYKEDAMDQIEKVAVKINGQVHEMNYIENDQRFIITVADLQEGTYEYTFLVTINGVTSEVSDPYNLSVDRKSYIEYRELKLNLNATVYPETIDYNENAVLSVDVTGIDNESDIREFYVDLTALGGKNKVKISPELNSVTIAVRDNVATGVKTLPITLVDKFGYTHNTEATISVKPRVVTSEKDFDWDEARIYFMLTDRFADGDASNNFAPGYDPSSPGHYQGGDFKGVTQNLDYLYDLGINTIWITPIVENIYYDVAYNSDQIPYYAYHGYWALNFEELNPHLGTLDDFHELIDAASDRGMKIMVDIVVNHTGYGLKAGDGNTTNPPVGYTTDEDRARFAHMLRHDGGIPGHDVFGELAGLPDLKTEVPEVRQQLVDWQVAWLDKARTEKGNTIDYFRVDTVKHVDSPTWMALKNGLTLEKPDFKMIGEVWGAGPNNDSGFLNSGTMDSLVDFDFKYIARDLVNGQITSVNNRISARNESINNTATLGQFLGSHDEDGFLEQFRGADGTVNLALLKVAAALQITSKGQPVIYYGEELGLSGVDNWPYYDNRPVFPWHKVEGNDVLAHYQKLLHARKDYSQVFSKGTHTLLKGNNATGYMIFERKYNGESVVVGINTKDAAANVSVQVPFAANSTVTDVYNGHTYTVGENGEVNLTLPGRAEGATFILVAGVVLDPIDGSEPTEPEVPVTGEPGTSTEPEAPVTEEPGTSTEPEVPVTEEQEKSTEPGKEQPITPQPEKPATEKPGTTKPVAEAPKAEQKVNGNLDKKTNVVTIDTKSVMKVATNGLLIIDLKATEGNTVAKVQLTKEQVTELRSKNATVELMKNNVSVSFPMANLLGNEPVEFMIEQYQDYKGALSAVYDFTVKQGETIISNFEQPVKLTFKVDAFKVKNPNNVKVFYYNEETGKWENIGGTYKNGYITAETYHFSIFTVFEVEDTVEELAGDAPMVHVGVKLPDTATALYNYLLIGMLLIAAGSSIFFYQRKKLAKTN